MIPMVQRKRNCKFVTVVHDLESLRGGIEGVIKIIAERISWQILFYYGTWIV